MSSHWLTNMYLEFADMSCMQTISRLMHSLAGCFQIIENSSSFKKFVKMECKSLLISLIGISIVVCQLHVNPPPILGLKTLLCPETESSDFVLYWDQNNIASFPQPLICPIILIDQYYASQSFGINSTKLVKTCPKFAVIVSTGDLKKEDHFQFCFREILILAFDEEPLIPMLSNAKDAISISHLMLLVLTKSHWTPSYVNLGSKFKTRRNNWPKGLQKSCNPGETVVTCLKHSQNLYNYLTTQNVTYSMQLLICEDRFSAFKELADTKKQISQSLELYHTHGPNLKHYPQISLSQNILYQIFRPNLKYLKLMSGKQCKKSVFKLFSKYDMKPLLHMLLPQIRYDDKKFSFGSCNTHLTKNYWVDTNQYNFITCNSESPTFSFKMYIEFFDTEVWIGLLCSMSGIMIIIGLVLQFMESLKFSRTTPMVGLVLFGSLLNVSLDYKPILKLGKLKTRRFVATIFGIWFLLAAIVNYMYQIVVITHMTHSCSDSHEETPWNRIDQLNDFSILTSLVPGIPSIENFTENEFNETWTGDLDYRMIKIKNPNARMKSLTLNRNSIFYNGSKQAFIARSYSDFGFAAWNKLDPECLTHFRMGGCNGLLNKPGVSFCFKTLFQNY